MPADRPVTGTVLRDMVVCERRVWHDAHTAVGMRDEVGSFVQMLWAEGSRHETQMLAALTGVVIDLRGEAPRSRRRATMRALLDPAADHVLGGEISHDGLVGRPDLISRIDGRWVCGDAKSGTPYMPDGVRVREEYGVQIGLYARIMHAASLGDGHRAFVIGPDGARVMFDMDAPWGTSSMASIVGRLVAIARTVLDGTAVTRGEASARCGLCHWRTLCRGELEAADDLTLVAELGRKLRMVVEEVAPTRAALAALDVDAVVRPDGRPGLPGLGAARLARFRDRARLQVAPGANAYARAPLGLVRQHVEYHLDIEADPTRRGLVYLHGIWVRLLDDDGTERNRFVHFFADGPDGERQAFAAAWRFLTADPSRMVYYYSAFERTSYRALQSRHPDVCTASEVEEFFARPRTVDLYTDVVRPHTEWPTSSYGLKPLAKLNGFSWSAADASGAASIAWYDEYVNGGDPAVRARIVEYNRQDCEASAVVLDALIALPVGAPHWPPSPVHPDQPADGRSDAAIGSTADPADPTGARDEAAWRAEGEELNRFFVERTSGDHARPSDAPAAGASSPRSPPVTWSTPTLRPCTAMLPDDRGSGHDGVVMAETYGSLASELPLFGAAAMRPEAGGEVALGRALRGEFPWMAAAVSAVERQLAIASWAGRPWLQLRPLCLVGGPGVGKSRFAHRLATLAGVGSAALDLGAMHDAAALVAVSRGWSNAKPCWPAQMMNTLGCANPVLILDELEKAGGSRRNGEPQQALLAMTEPGTARRYFDACLMVEVDLSAVCWIATANTVDGIAAPLASRFEIVPVGPPGPEHFEVILESVVAERERDWGLPAGAVPPIPNDARAILRRAFHRQRSLRALRRHVEMVLHALIVGAARRLH
jgi:predicted RecB family nuclease